MDIMSFVIGTSGLVAVVDKIFLLSHVIHDIKSFPRDMAELVIQLRYEKEKICVWSEEAILRSRSQELSTKLNSRLLQDSHQNAIAVCVEGISNALENANRLASIYIPDSPQADVALENDIVATDISSSLNVQRIWRNKLERILRLEVSTRKKVFAVVKPWGQPEREELKQALADLTRWNKELESLLMRQDIISLRLELSTRVMATFKDDPNALRIIGLTETTHDDDTAASARLSLQVKQSEVATPMRSHGWFNSNLDEGSNSDHYIDWLDCSDLTYNQRQIAANRIDALCELSIPLNHKTSPHSNLWDLTMTKKGSVTESS